MLNFPKLLVTSSQCLAINVPKLLLDLQRKSAMHTWKILTLQKRMANNIVPLPFCLTTNLRFKKIKLVRSFLVFTKGMATIHTSIWVCKIHTPKNVTNRLTLVNKKLRFFCTKVTIILYKSCNYFVQKLQDAPNVMNHILEKSYTSF